jgi:hypothetical protein
MDLGSVGRGKRIGFGTLQFGAVDQSALVKRWSLVRMAFVFLGQAFWFRVYMGFQRYGVGKCLFGLCSSAW